MTARMPLHSISPKARRFKRQNTKKKKKNHSINTFPSLQAKKKKKNTMIIIIKKNDSFEIVRPIYHLHTHTHIYVSFILFSLLFFFFFRPLGVPRRVEKWGENGKTTKMWHGRWSGLGGTGGRVEERERVGKTSSRRRRMNFNSARAK